MEKEPNMRGRREASRATKLRRRKTRMNFILLAGFAALIVLLVLVTPKDPLRRATYSNATESGLVEGDGNEVIGAYEGLVISEVMSANSTAVTDENGKYADWVEIWNSTDKPINLNGLGLSDKGDRVRFLFPNVSLDADGRVVVFCDNTNQSNPNQAFHAKFKLSSVGETVYLYDPNAYLIDSCKVPIMASNESWALVDGTFRNVTWYSPGFENTEEGNRKYRESISVSDGSVVINEVMADPMTGLRDDDDELCDWVELYNTTDRDISLAGLGLSGDSCQRILYCALHRQRPDGPDQECAAQQFPDQRGERNHCPRGQPGPCTGPRDDRQSATGLQLGPERSRTDAGVPDTHAVAAQQSDGLQPDGYQPARHEQERRVHQRSDGEQRFHHNLCKG